MKNEIPPPFSSLTGEQFIRFCQQGQTRYLPSEAVLFHQGDSARELFYLRGGRLKLIKLNESGKEIIIHYVNTGEICAAMAVLQDGVYPVTAYVEDKCELITWRKTVFERLLLQYPEVTRFILSMAFKQIRELQQRYLELCTEQVDRRIAHSLLRLLQHCGEKNSAAKDPSLFMSLQNIADYSGTTLHTVSRTLSVWKKRGWVQTRRQQIIICKPDELELLLKKPTMSDLSL